MHKCDSSSERKYMVYHDAFHYSKWYDIDKCIEIKNSDSESPRELLNKFIILYLASCVYLLRVSHPKKDAFWR